MLKTGRSSAASRTQALLATATRGRLAGDFQNVMTFALHYGSLP